MPSEAAGTIVELYQCHQCGRQRYAREIADGTPCNKCGSKYLMALAPTRLNVITFFLHNPQMLLVYIKENILGRA